MTHPPRTKALGLPLEVAAELDPGIRATVAWLRDQGLETTDSGDGRTKLAAMECALPYPHVVGRIQPEALVSETRRIAAAVMALGLEVGQMSETPEPGVVVITASYDAANDIALILVDGLDDELLQERLVAVSAVEAPEPVTVRESSLPAPREPMPGEKT